MRVKVLAATPFDRLSRDQRRDARCAGSMCPLLLALALVGVLLFVDSWGTRIALGQKGIDLAGFSKLAMEELRAGRERCRQGARAPRADRLGEH